MHKNQSAKLVIILSLMNPFHFSSFCHCNHPHPIRPGDTTQTEGGLLGPPGSSGRFCLPWPRVCCVHVAQHPARKPSSTPGCPPACTHHRQGSCGFRSSTFRSDHRGNSIMKDTPRVNLGCDENKAHKPLRRVTCPTLCQAVQQPVTCDIFPWVKEATFKQNHHPCKIGRGWLLLVIF